VTEPDAGGAGAGSPDESHHDESDHAPHCYRHPDRETYVACVRCGRPICPECMRPASVGFQCPEEFKDAARTTRAPRTVLGGAVAHSGRDATTILIGLNVVVFLIMTASGTSFLGSSHISTLFARFALVSKSGTFVDGSSVTHLTGIANGAWYRLITAMFLHFGILHIASNMYVLFLVGPALERALGRTRFVALYFVAGFGGSVASFLLASTSEIGAGASGAIFGLFGAYYVVARKLGGETGAILGTIVVNLFISVAIPGIDIRAHIGGLITGAILGAVLAYAPRERQTAVQAGGFVVVAVILVVIAVVRGADIRHQQPSPSVNALASPAQAVTSPDRSLPTSSVTR
jgi:membrane associated rhomboid family serine protease